MGTSATLERRGEAGEVRLAGGRPNEAEAETWACLRAAALHCARREARALRTAELDAEDVANEALLRLWRASERVPVLRAGGPQATSWLVRAVRFVACEGRAAARRRELLARRAAQGPGAPEREALEQDVDLLCRVLARRAPRSACARVVALLASGLGLEDIGLATGLSGLEVSAHAKLSAWILHATPEREPFGRASPPQRPCR